MQIYLPIAEIPVNIFLILALGLLTGFLAGMFGIGGGFLATPFLIFIGVPSPVAVSTSTNQIIAASISGLLAHFKKGNVDIKMGLFFNKLNEIKIHFKNKTYLNRKKITSFTALIF